MRKVLNTLSGMALAAALALLPAAASAQTNPLVGLWLMITHDNQGHVIAYVWAQFTADGHITTRFVTQAGTVQYTGEYQLLNNNTAVQARYDDYQPKQMCTALCSPVTPTMPIGQVMNTPVAFNGPNAFCFVSDCYTRQQ